MEEHKEQHRIKEAFLAGLSLFLIICGAIVVFFAIYKIHDIVGIFNKMCHILMPIILGVVFAYLVNPIVVFFEKYLNDFWTSFFQKPLKKESTMRLPAILLTMCLVFFAAYLLLSMVIPELYSNLTKLIYTLPDQMTEYYLKIMHLASSNEWMREFVKDAYESIMEFVTGWVKKELLSQISMLIDGLFGIVSVLSKLLIGCIVSIYLLLSKEVFSRQYNLLLHAFFSEEVSAQIKEIMHESDKIFGGFISGKIVDSLIIGVLFFILASILHLPYVVLVSVIIGVTNVIPFFGPYIGAVPSAILIFMESPSKCLVFIVLIVIVQQFDGSILGPKILGDSTGLSPFWIIFSILLGSGLFGFVGMLMGVPTFAVIYYLIKRYVHYLLKKKDSLPAEIEQHLNISEETK